MTIFDFFGFANPSSVAASKLIKEGYYLIQTTSTYKYKFLFSRTPFQQNDCIICTSHTYTFFEHKRVNYYIIAKVKSCERFSKELFKQHKFTTEQMEGFCDVCKYDNRFSFYRVDAPSEWYPNRKLVCFTEEIEPLDFSVYNYSFQFAYQVYSNDYINKTMVNREGAAVDFIDIDTLTDISLEDAFTRDGYIVTKDITHLIIKKEKKSVREQIQTPSQPSTTQSDYHKSRWLYLNHCWNCKQPINSDKNRLCPKCHRFYICSNCGYCKCGYNDSKK